MPTRSSLAVSTNSVPPDSLSSPPNTRCSSCLAMIPLLAARAALSGQSCCISARLAYPEREAGSAEGAGMRKAVVGALAAGMALAGSVAAQDFTPAIIFDMGGKFDKSFNEAAYNGAERFRQETGTEYLEFEVTNESQRDQA